MGSIQNLWNSQVERSYDHSVNRAKDNINTHLTNVEMQSRGAGVGIQSAVQSINESKRIIDSEIQAINVKANELKDKNTQILDNQARTNVSPLKQQLQSNKEELEKATLLNNIRKEQSAALKQKYDSNYHSSWLGLWRPLNETSRFGIFIAAISFGMIAIAAIVYLFMTRKSAPVGGNVSQTFGAFIGGALRKLTAVRRK